MPVCAIIVPELLMPPAKVEMVTLAPPNAVPPTKMPRWAAEMRPLLLMPPEKVEMVMDDQGCA